jgi:hypothetical protein
MALIDCFLGGSGEGEAAEVEVGVVGLGADRNNCGCRFNQQGAQDAECPSYQCADAKANCTDQSHDDGGIELLFGLGRLASFFLGAWG